MSKAYLLMIIIIFCHSYSYANCEYDVSQNMKYQEAIGMKYAMNIVDHDLQLALTKLWEVNQLDIQLAINAKCKSISIRQCWNRINQKMMTFRNEQGPMLPSETKNFKWRCTPY